MTTDEKAIQELLQSCKYMIDEAIRMAPFDKTVNAKVIGVGVGKSNYVVEIGGEQFTLPSYNSTTLATNQIVKVNIPRNEMSNAYIT